ncbi:MAG: protein-glutamate O-methyltransferase CheR [Proteobacteria bacterium]|nr:protein-glutamate O-methyltransferase CheR [Pseudomonadota bacterium]
MTSAALRRHDVPVLVDGEFPFTREDFRFIANTIYEMAGITLTETKANLVYSRLAKRVRALKIGSFEAYCALVASPEGAEERDALLTALTTNVTRFFREPHHFDHLRDNVIAPAADTLRRGGRMRLWSAACSSGQEPYSMALTILSVLPEAADLDIKILATDIDEAILRQAAAGAYNAEQVAPVPREMRSRFERTGDAANPWRVSRAVRDLVTFRRLNLIEPWPVHGPFDAIFCRNVVIYFDEATQERVWARFAPLLAPDGRLYIGHSERVSESVRRLVTDGQTVYRRVDGATS